MDFKRKKGKDLKDVAKLLKTGRIDIRFGGKSWSDPNYSRVGKREKGDLRVYDSFFPGR